jgi:cysteinyl-tRNA synthetase
MHNNFLIARDSGASGKMSKSSGEFLRVQLLINKGFHPLAYRLMCLQAHYRSELEFSWEGLQAALVRLKRMVMGVSNLKARHAELASASYLATSESKTLKQVQGDVAPGISAALKDFSAAVEDDLNTAIAITSLETLIGLKKVDAAQHLAAIAEMDNVLGLNLMTLTRTDLRVRPKAAVITEAEIETALLLRKDARAAKDFAKSDAIRDDLIAKGVEVMDGDPLGWDWKLDV